MIQKQLTRLKSYDLDEVTLWWRGWRRRRLLLYAGRNLIVRRHSSV